MAKMRGGMDFPAGRLRQVAAVPARLQAAPVTMHVLRRPEVHTGQHVTAGQIVNESRIPGRGNRVSPFDGTITRMEPLADDQSKKTYELQITADHRETDTALSIDPPQGRELANWLVALGKIDPWLDRDGAVGLLAQLEAAKNRRPDIVILNGLDRFPPYPDSSSLLASFTDAAAQGLRLIADLVKAPDAVMVIAKAMQIASQLRADCRNHSIRLMTTHNVYPMAHPTMLAWTTLPGARRLAPGVNPVAQRLMIINPWTAIRLGKWLMHGRLGIARPIFIGWPETGSHMAVRYALPGQSLLRLHDRLEQCVIRSTLQVLLGHPMDGRKLFDSSSDDDDPYDVMVPDDELLLTCLGMDCPVTHETHACISCGWCGQVCPTQLRPAEMFRLCKRGGPADILLPQLNGCVNCGLCTHVCPSSLPLAQTFRQMSARFERFLK